MSEEAPVPRLCSEIQLFDLCEEETCNYKREKFCNKGELLTRFETILAKEDERSPEQYLAEELDEVEGEGDLAYDEAFAVDEYEDEDEEEG
jgi:hypothetical protein